MHPPRAPGALALLMQNTFAPDCPQGQNGGAGGGRFEKEFLAGMAEMVFVLHNSQCG